MLINRVSRQIMTCPELEPLVRALGAGDDATLAVAQSARPTTRARACLWSRARKRPTAPPARSPHGSARTSSAATPSAETTRGARRPPRIPWSAPAAAPSRAWPRGSAASSWRRRARCCAACRPQGPATGPRARFPWATRCPSTRSRPFLWAWVTPTTARSTFPEASTCTATRWTFFRRRPRRRCASSSSATRSTVCAAWSRLPAKPSVSSRA